MDADRYSEPTDTMQDLNTKWLEDFVALSKAPNLFRAAEQRNVTHPAFGRRIRALEEWVGMPLVERNGQITTLNAAGRVFLASAQEVLDILQDTRLVLRQPGEVRVRKLSIATGRTLSHSILPGLLKGMRAVLPPFKVKVVTTSLGFGIDMLARGEVDVLLCHAHESLQQQLDSERYVYRRVGGDTLVAVSLPMAHAYPKYRVPKTPADSHVPFLDYASSMSMKRILDSRMDSICLRQSLDVVYESDLAESILAMVRNGDGLAWLPRTLVSGDLASGHLVRADTPDNDIAMEIRLYRAAGNPKAIVKRAWEALESGAG